MALLFHSHPEWKLNESAVDRKIKVDMEAGYQSAEFAEYCRIVLFTAIVSKPHPHVTNMLMVSLRGQ